MRPLEWGTPRYYIAPECFGSQCSSFHLVIMRLLVVCLAIGLLAGESLSQGLIGGLVRRVSNLIRYKNENRGQDGYEFAYETDDGTVREEKGGYVNGIWTVEGKSVWRDEQGVDHQTKYKADDKGTTAETMEGRISQAALASLAG